LQYRPDDFGSAEQEEASGNVLPKFDKLAVNYFYRDKNMLEKKEKKPPFLVLLILDGWGITSRNIGNIFSSAEINNYKELISKYPAAALSTMLGRKKAVSKGNNYFIIGTGGYLQKKTSSLIDKLEKAGIKTLSICDQEKYPEMNFFFTGRKKSSAYSQIVIKNSRDGKTTPFLTEALIKAIKKNEYGFIAAAFSDLDAAAGRGDVPAAISAAAEIDSSLKKIIKIILNRGGLAIITAAAGRAEALIDPQTEMINRKNTANPVPFILVGEKFEGQTINFPEAPAGDLALVEPAGDISAIAPTILKLLDPKTAEELNNRSLV
jgi:bisphosphoglycerate-independent phosphoglycerate mutase (AlkP superfamily)